MQFAVQEQQRGGLHWRELLLLYQAKVVFELLLERYRRRQQQQRGGVNAVRGAGTAQGRFPLA
jgi:hypothetical protein